MRISISNIAWDTVDDGAVSRLCQHNQIDAIDVAPGKYFPDIAHTETAQIKQIRTEWQARGIEIIGMQSLLFGTQGLNLFAGNDSRQAMLEHLQAVFRIAEHLGARSLVFGSPKNRDQGTLSNTEAMLIAQDFFYATAECAYQHGVCLCLEANPPCYGCNFITTTDDAAELVRQTGHSSFRLHLDTGTIFINGESGSDIVSKHADIIGHVHASMPGLIPLSQSNIEQDKIHAAIAIALQRHRPDLTISIEMLNPSAQLGIIDASLAKACQIYREMAPAP